MNNKKEKEHSEENYEFGKYSFGRIFKGIGDLIDLASRLGEEGIEKKGEIKGLPKDMKGIYGLSIKTLAGKPIIDTFGNIKTTSKGPVVEEIREPIVDVFDEKNYIIVIAELPGIEKENIKIEVRDDILNLSASNKDRKYSKEILLPSKVNKDSMQLSYKNGILEIKLLK